MSRNPSCKAIIVRPKRSCLDSKSDTQSKRKQSPARTESVQQSMSFEGSAIAEREVARMRNVWSSSTQPANETPRRVRGAVSASKTPKPKRRRARNESDEQARRGSGERAGSGGDRFERKSKVRPWARGEEWA